MHHRAACLCRRSTRTVIASNRLTLTLSHNRLFRWHDRALSDTPSSHPLGKEHGDGNPSWAASANPASAFSNYEWQTELGELDVNDAIDAKDIFVDDLSATLEAHRETNKASIIRRVQANAEWEAPYLSPLADIEPIASSKDETVVGRNADSTPFATVVAEDTTLEASDGPENPEIRMGQNHEHWTRVYWPADSVQLAELTGKTYKAKPAEVLEYKACLISTQGLFKEKLGKAQRPWLAPKGKAQKLLSGNSHQRLAYQF